MNPDWRFNRRGFLWRLLAGLGATVPAIGSGAEPEVAASWRLPDTGPDLRRVLERYFDNDPRAAAELGRIRIMIRPEGDAALRSRLADTLETIAGAADVDDALARLERAVREDFDQLRLESLHGWQLARTEVDLCLVAWSLSTQRP